MGMGAGLGGARSTGWNDDAGPQQQSIYKRPKNLGENPQSVPQAPTASAEPIAIAMPQGLLNGRGTPLTYTRLGFTGRNFDGPEVRIIFSFKGTPISIELRRLPNQLQEIVSEWGFNFDSAARNNTDTTLTIGDKRIRLGHSYPNEKPRSDFPHPFCFGYLHVGYVDSDNGPIISKWYGPRGQIFSIRREWRAEVVSLPPIWNERAGIVRLRDLKSNQIVRMRFNELSTNERLVPGQHLYVREMEITSPGGRRRATEITPVDGHTFPDENKLERALRWMTDIVGYFGRGTS